MHFCVTYIFNLFIYWKKVMMIITIIIIIIIPIIILIILKIIRSWLNHWITFDRLSNLSIFFALSNTTVKNMSMFVHSVTEQIQFKFLHQYHIKKQSSLITTVTSFSIVSKAKTIVFLKFWQNGSILKSPMKWGNKVSQEDI